MTSLPERFNFAEHLFDLNRAHTERTAYIDDRGRLSYGDLEDRARRLASVLAEAGVRREERVLLLMHDTSDWPVCFLGCLYAGVVPVAVNTLLTADDYAYMLAHSRAQAALVSGALLPVLSEAMARSAHEVGTLLVSLPVGKLHAGARDLEAALNSASPLAAPAPTGADDPGFWLYSSGSTGKPKGTVHTHGNLWWTAELYGKPVLGLTQQDVCFSAAKLYFAYGLGNALTFPVSVGATVVLMAERPTPDATCSHHPGCQRVRRWRCACAPRQARRCPQRSRSASRLTLAATSSMALAPPRCCTSFCPTDLATSDMAPPASPCRATRCNCVARTARACPTARWATSTSEAPALL
jgi:benzoate-CoA ligase